MSYLTPAEARDRCWIQSGPCEARTAHEEEYQPSLEATFDYQPQPSSVAGSQMHTLSVSK